MVHHDHLLLIVPKGLYTQALATKVARCDFVASACVDGVLQSRMRLCSMRLCSKLLCAQGFRSDDNAVACGFVACDFVASSCVHKALEVMIMLSHAAL